MPVAYAGLLHAKIAAVCPIDGVSIGDPLNPATWRIDFDPSATAPQIAAAQALVATIVLANLRPSVIAASDWLDRFTPAEQTAMWAALAPHPAILGAVLIRIAAGSIDLSSAPVKTFHDLMVTAGIITALRETAILTP